MYRAVPNLIVSDNGTLQKPGHINGCLIYSFNMSFGVGSTQTSCSMNVVTKRGRYPDFTKRLSFLSPYIIKVDGMQPIYMYLVSSKLSESAEQKTVQLDFIDGSHILDRIYVGLLHRHDGYNRILNVGKRKVGFEVPILCQPCDPYTQGKSGSNKIKFIKPTDPKFGPLVTRTNDFSFLIPYGNSKIGGFMIMGKEKWAENDCAIKDVDYNLTELKVAAANIGVVLNMNDHRPEFRTSYTGTLREVLSKWSADFGITWTYDYFNAARPVVHEIASNSSASNLRIRKIAQIARSIRGQNSIALVENVEEETSIKDTYKQYVVTSYKKPKAPKQDHTTTYYRTYSSAVLVEDVFPKASLDGRTYDQFKISCGLAKFSPELRTLYNLTINSLIPLGFTATYKVPARLKKEIIDQCLNTETYLDIIDYIAGPYATNADIANASFDMFIGSYSKTMEDNYIQWERDVGSFLGKFYHTSVLGNDWRYCPDKVDYKYITTTSLSPDAEFYYGSKSVPKQVCFPTRQILSQGTATEIKASALAARATMVTNFYQYDLPFTEIMRGGLGRDIFVEAPPWTQQAKGGAKPTKKLKKSRYVRIHNRTTAVYDKDQHDFDCCFTNPATKESLLTRYMPRYQEIVGMMKTKILARFAETRDDIRETIESADQDTTPCLMIIPKMKRLKQIIAFSDPAGNDTLNDKEVPNTYLERAKALKNDKPCDKTSLCAQQSDLVAMVCDCGKVPGVPPKELVNGAIFEASRRKFPEGIVSAKSFAVGISFTPDPLAKTVQKADGTFTKVYDTFKCHMSLGFPSGSTSSAVIKKAVAAKDYPKAAQNLFQCNYVEDIERTRWTNKVLAVINNFNIPVGNVGGVRIVDNDVTQNLDSFVQGGGASRIPQVFIPPVLNTAGGTDLGKIITMADYHKMMLILNHQGTEQPKVSLSVNLGSSSIGELLPYTKVALGLNSLNISIGEGGSTASLSWSSGLTVRPAQDVIMNQVIPRAKYSIYTS